MILPLLAAASCVPVHYDAKGWDRIRSSPEVAGGLRVSLNLDASKSNAFNSNNRGPWEFYAGFSSAREHKLVIDVITIRGTDGRLIQRIEPRSAVGMFPIHGEFRANYSCDRLLELPDDHGNVVRATLDFSVDGKPAAPVEATFRARSIQGWEVINLGTT